MNSATTSSMNSSSRFSLTGTGGRVSLTGRGSVASLTGTGGRASVSGRLSLTNRQSLSGQPSEGVLGMPMADGQGGEGLQCGSILETLDARHSMGNLAIPEDSIL